MGAGACNPSRAFPIPDKDLHDVFTVWPEIPQIQGLGHPSTSRNHISHGVEEEAKSGSIELTSDDVVAFTCRLIAAARAYESFREDGLFHDPFAELLVRHYDKSRGHDDFACGMAVLFLFDLRPHDERAGNFCRRCPQSTSNHDAKVDVWTCVREELALLIGIPECNPSSTPKRRPLQAGSRARHVFHRAHEHCPHARSLRHVLPNELRHWLEAR